MSNHVLPPIGGGGGARTPVLVSGSPFADLAALETWSQANPSELLNNETQVATAQVGTSPDFITYEWIGANGVYSADSWSNASGLTQEQSEFIESGVNSPDDQLVLVRSGKIEPSSAFQLVDETTIRNDEGAYEAGPSLGYNLGLAWRLNSAGQNVNFENQGANENFHPVWQKYAVGRENIFARDRVADVTIPIETTFSDVLTDPVWSVTVPSVFGEEGQTATFTDVKFDASSTLTNIDVLININGVDYRTVTIPLATVGDFKFEYDPPTDFYVGDTITFTVTSKDGSVALLGNNATSTPYVIQDVLLWNDVPVGLLSDQVPKYKNAFSTDLIAYDGQTYAADASNLSGGGFTITADANANSFSVFDYAGNWNGGMRTVTVSIGADNYFLTRRNREYFFYKDEIGNWQWYYKPNFRG